MALSPAWEGAQTRSYPRIGSVLDAVRLRHTGFGAAPEGAYVLEDRAATRSFSCQGGPRLRSGTEGVTPRPPETGGGYRTRR